MIVDPKGGDYSVYRGVTVITPNRKELGEATRMAVGSHKELRAATRALGQKVGAEAVLVTLSEDGMMLNSRAGEPLYAQAHQVKVRDVSGAGDTVAATFAVMMAMHADLDSAMRAANAAASVVVGKPGTATASMEELRARLLPPATHSEDKIVHDRRELDARLEHWRAQDLRIGFTNGVFDLLHPGHIKVLAQSRSHCEKLVVGLNSDASVRRLKGKDRPIQSEQARAEVLAGLEAVDLVVVFGEDTPLELIRRVKPTVLVKGGDYKPDQVVGREVVKAQGGEVIVVDLVKGSSTTRIVEKSRRRKKR